MLCNEHEGRKIPSISYDVWMYSTSFFTKVLFPLMPIQHCLFNKIIPSVHVLYHLFNRISVFCVVF